MLYILENTDKLGADFLDEALHLLSLQRIRKIDRLRNLSDRISGAAVYLMLRYALKKEYGINDIVVFDFGQHCKPFLSGQSFQNSPPRTDSIRPDHCFTAFFDALSAALSSLVLRTHSRISIVISITLMK